MMFNGTKTWPDNKVIETLSQWACVLVAMLMPIPAMTKRVSGEFANYAETKSATSDGNFSEWSNAATFEKLEVDAERG